MTARNHRRFQSGFLMIEVLITMVILVVGLLGLAGLQARAQQAENESYQRVQALILLRDITDRINANRASAANYVKAGGTQMGKGYAGSDPDCAAPATLVDSDLCAWHAALQGAAEASGGACDPSSGSNCVGAMIGARGCVSSPAANIYLVEVAWQGLVRTAAPPASVTCGSGSYGDETQRRVVTSVVEIGNLN